MIRAIPTFVLVALLSTAAVGADEVRNPNTHFFQQSFGDFQEEAGLAAEEGLFGVMVMSGAFCIFFGGELMFRRIFRSRLED